MKYKEDAEALEKYMENYQNSVDRGVQKLLINEYWEAHCLGENGFFSFLCEDNSLEARELWKQLTIKFESLGDNNG